MTRFEALPSCKPPPLNPKPPDFHQILRSVETKKPAAPTSERLRALLPDIWELVKPRRKILLIGFVLMLINRIFGLALPASTKILIDEIIGKRRTELLLPLVLAVIGATLIQGITS